MTREDYLELACAYEVWIDLHCQSDYDAFYKFCDELVLKAKLEERQAILDEKVEI